MGKQLQYISQEEENSILSHFYNRLEQVIRDNDLMRYNNSSNSLNDVYAIVLEHTYEMMIPGILHSVNDLYEYNVLQNNHAQDKLTLEYVKEHFDKLVG